MFFRFYLFLVAIVFFFNSNPSFADGKFKGILQIVFENANVSEVMNQSYFKKLADSGALLTNMSAETHPSQGNYISMIAGDRMGVNNDNNVDLNGEHLGDLLERKNLHWKAYAEDFPENCFLGKTSGKYARKHVPFISFLNVSTRPERCANIVNGNRFWQDVKSGTLPEYSMYIPNLNNDGHDTGVDNANNFLQNNFGSLFSDVNFLKDHLVIITFDENKGAPANKIYTVLLGNSVLAGSKTTQSLNHISLLKLIEEEWRLGTLGRGDASAEVPKGIWK